MMPHPRPGGGPRHWRHCNGTDKAALRLAGMGRRVKVMIGGMTGWADEGFPFAREMAAG